MSDNKITQEQLGAIADKDSIKVVAGNGFIVSAHFKVKGYRFRLLFTPDLDGLWGLSYESPDRDIQSLLLAIAAGAPDPDTADE